MIYERSTDLDGSSSMDRSDTNDLETIDLRKIEQEIQLENVRQHANKFTWDYFHQQLRKNLMEKQYMISPEDRDDAAEALATLRETLPSDVENDLFSQLRLLAENLSFEIQINTGCCKLKSADFNLDITIAENSQVSACAISWYGEKMVEARVLRDYMIRDRWDLVHSKLSTLIRLIPHNLSRDEKTHCLRSLECIEKDLLNFVADDVEKTASLERRINVGRLGLCQPRNESTPFVIFPAVDPTQFFSAEKGVFLSSNDEALYDVESFVQLCLVPSEKANFFSDSPLYANGQWRNATTGRQLPAQFCIKFAKPIVFSAASIEKLAKLAPTELNVEDDHNLYEYLMDSNQECRQIFVELPGCPTMRFTFDDLMLEHKKDGIIREITFSHPRDLITIMKIIRSQLAHNLLFESLLRSRSVKNTSGEIANVHIISSSTENIELQFLLNQNLYIARISASTNKMNATLECVSNGVILPESKLMTSILDRTWSLALMVRSLLRRCITSVDSSVQVKQEVLDDEVDVKPTLSSLINKCESSKISDSMQDDATGAVDDKSDVKMCQSWLYCVVSTNDHLRHHLSTVDHHAFDVIEDHITPIHCKVESLDEQLSCSLLALLCTEPDQQTGELIPPPHAAAAAAAAALTTSVATSTPKMACSIGSGNGAIPRSNVSPRNEMMLAPRTARMHSENTMTINALSDLDAICDMAANIDDAESNVSEHSSSRSSIVERFSPSANEVQRLRPQVPSQSPSPANERYRQAPISQLSPLEIARQRLAQQAPMNSQADVFDFDETPRMGVPANAMANSTGHTQFQFAGHAQPGVYHPYAGVSPSGRGALAAQPIAKRRGRGRKAGNIGDRIGDSMRAAMIDPNTGIMQTSMNLMTTRKPRGTATPRRPRRPRKAVHLSASPANSHQFGMNRSVLQRSFSEIRNYPLPLQPMALSHETRSETISEFETVDESSDDETDPPPPVRLAQANASTGGSNNLGAAPNSVSIQSNLPAAYQKTSASTPQAQSTAISSVPAVVETTLAATTTTMPSASAQHLFSASSKPRKASLEAVVGKLHCKSAPSTSGGASCTSSNPYSASDIYDDESEPSTKTMEQHSSSSKRDSPSVTLMASSSPSARASPSTKSSQGSDLKIMIKLKQQTSSSARSNSLQSSGNVTPSMRLVGQPPSSARSKEEKALQRQKQLKEKSRHLQEDRNRAKLAKRERKIEMNTNKKPKTVNEQKAGTSASQKVEFPHALAFASLKNFKIPKVMENEKCESPTSSSGAATSSTSSTSTSIPPTSSTSLPANTHASVSNITTPSTAQPTNQFSASSANPTSFPSSSQNTTSSIFPPKPPKSILKSSMEPASMYRSMSGMPPMMSGRRPLLPDPRSMMHHPPRIQFRPPVGPRMVPPGMGGPGFMPPPSSGRWMALAPQRMASPRDSPSEQASLNDRSADTFSCSKMQDSPGEGLKIVADDD